MPCLRFFDNWTSDIQLEVNLQSLSHALRPWPWPNSSDQWKVSAHRWSQTKGDLRVFWRFHCNAIFSCATGKRAQLTTWNDEKVPISVRNRWRISTLRFDAIIYWNRCWKNRSFSLADINVYQSDSLPIFVLDFSVPAMVDHQFLISGHSICRIALRVLEHLHQWMQVVVS